MATLLTRRCARVGSATLTSLGADSARRCAGGPREIRQRPRRLLGLAEFDGLVKAVSYAAGADAAVRGEVEIADPRSSPPSRTRAPVCTGIAPTVLAVFRKYDTDGNGTLSGTEFGARARMYSRRPASGRSARPNGTRLVRASRRGAP